MPPAIAQTTDWSALVMAAKPAVVWIRCDVPDGSSAGTGALISPDGYILTAAHVIEGATRITVLVAETREYGASLVVQDTNADIALLNITASDLVWLAFGDSDALDQEIRLLGCPKQEAGFGLILGRRFFLGRRKTAAAELLQLQVDPFDHGHSGGPGDRLESGEKEGMQMRFKSSKLWGLALLLVGLGLVGSLGPGRAQSCSVTVYPGESIQSAIDAVSAGAVICLAEGSWQENLTITKDDLILRGQGPSRTIVIGSFLIQVAGQFTVESLALQSSVGGAAPSEMVLIPAGTFQMGDSFSEGSSDERPVHTVYVSAFYIDKFEVTKALWDEVASWAAANGYDISASSGEGKGPDHPVYDVSWYEAVKWANARSEREGLTPCYTVGGSVYRRGESTPDCNWAANGYRLPTEAEWEKAARGDCEGHRFPWCDTDTIQHARANYYSSSDSSYDTSPTRGYHPTYATGSMPYTSPVGSFTPNGYELYDMAGNVWEWVWDWFDSRYYAVSPGSDPRGPASGAA
ncbi:SUMF1/EgtB/PvdO family nonheme iron enzyme, partial [Candidatus Bipolaricaulota bacterium]|nr:SUMF1/EgtB/PvdO family nonheme iron enzyme [Candidatus Bipolaricaulota bacterium]